jgi:hypothetical protein
MEKVYQVFVSSTYSDLKDERRQVSETLAKAGYIPAGMELFPAADQEQLQFIERVIDRCDYYIVVIGGRYGSVADDNVSFTEKEYEYALRKGIPVLAFLHAEPDKIEVGKTDIEPTKAAKLKAFRDRLATGRLVRSWRTVHELCTEVLISVVQESNRRPGVGWVRGDQAIDPRVLQEAERLRIENAGLKERLLESTSEEIRFPPQLAGPESKFKFTVHMTKRDRDPPEVKIIHVAAPIGNVFINLYEDLLSEPPESKIRECIGSIVLDMSSVTAPDGFFDCEISHDDAEQLRFHFEALGLIETDLYDRDNSFPTRFQSRNFVWTITEKGRRYVVQHRAIAKHG